MLNAAFSPPLARPFAATIAQPLDADPSQQPVTQENQMDRLFMGMLDAYRSSGGLARAQEIFTIYRAQNGSDVATLARWIVKREVISFDWQSKVWLPLFQFNRVHMAPHAGLQPVLAILNPVFSPWEIALWFTQPNPWLEGCTPANSLETRTNAVLHAASADCLIAAA